MQKTPWFCEAQADVMLNYLPLRNVLTSGIKVMLKNKALPDPAKPCKHPWLVTLSLFLSLSLADLALWRLVSRVFSRRCHSSRGYPLDPAEAGPRHQSILKEISPDYSLEGLMLKLKLKYFGHLMQRADSFEKSLMLGKIEGRRRRGQ